MLIFKELILCAQNNKNGNDQIHAYSKFPGLRREFEGLSRATASKKTFFQGDIFFNIG